MIQEKNNFGTKQATSNVVRQLEAKVMLATSQFTHRKSCKFLVPLAKGSARASQSINRHIVNKTALCHQRLEFLQE